MKRPARTAFTIVELIVVIGIIGMLISLLLPAVQNAREAARRASCQVKLMQLSLALHLHHLSHEALPSGVRDVAGPIRHEPKGQHYSWIVQVLPYLEQENLQQQIDFATGVYHPNNRPAREVYLEVLSCPSQRSSGRASDYAGCHHDLEAPIDVDNHGVLFLNSAVRYEQVSDGRSHTLFVGEKITEEDANAGMPEPGLNGDVGPADFGWMSGTRAALRNTGDPINQFRRKKITPAAELAPADETAAATGAAAQLLHVGGFESRHLGGAQFAFGDGSVRFLSEQISTLVYRQLGHRADGQLLDDAAY